MHPPRRPAGPKPHRLGQLHRPNCLRAEMVNKATNGETDIKHEKEKKTEAEVTVEDWYPQVISKLDLCEGGSFSTCDLQQ